MEKLNMIQTPFIHNQSISKLKPETKTEGFGQMFKDALKQVQDAQDHSEQMTEKLVTGEVQDVHEVTIASQKASLSLQLTVQVRNKAVEAYQEMMRMQL